MRSPAELVDRRTELEQLTQTAPPDQRIFIDRLARADVGSAEVHEELLAAIGIQDARRDWIIANSPHVVELEQINTLIAAHPPLGHWPTAQPEPVQQVLDTLRLLAPTPDRREERGLADIDQQAIANDPVRHLEERRGQLRQLARREAGQVERDAIDNARATRITNLAHDALTTQPPWVIDFVRHLHDNDQLNGRDITELATRIVHTAAHQDRHGRLPDRWPELAPVTVEVPQPAIEIG